MTNATRARIPRVRLIIDMITFKSPSAAACGPVHSAHGSHTWIVPPSSSGVIIGLFHKSPSHGKMFGVQANTKGAMLTNEHIPRINAIKVFFTLFIMIRFYKLEIMIVSIVNCIRT